MKHLIIRVVRRPRNTGGHFFSIPSHRIRNRLELLRRTHFVGE